MLSAGTEPDAYGGTTHVGLIAFRLRAYGEFLETHVRVRSVEWPAILGCWKPCRWSGA